jgi:steroid delta-isomerase
MPDAAAIRATIDAHFEAIGAADADRVAHCYARDATVEDPAGGTPVKGRDRIRDHFAEHLTEERDIELILVVVTGRDAAIHFRATPRGGPSRDVIDTMTFDDDAHITSMRAYAA